MGKKGRIHTENQKTNLIRNKAQGFFVLMKKKSVLVEKFSGVMRPRCISDVSVSLRDWSMDFPPYIRKMEHKKTMENEGIIIMKKKDTQFNDNGPVDAVCPLKPR